MALNCINAWPGQSELSQCIMHDDSTINIIVESVLAYLLTCVYMYHLTVFVYLNLAFEPLHQIWPPMRTSNEVIITMVI